MNPYTSQTAMRIGAFAPDIGTAPPGVACGALSFFEFPFSGVWGFGCWGSELYALEFWGVWLRVGFRVLGLRFNSLQGLLGVWHFGC